MNLAPTSSTTATPSFAKAARPRRDAAFVIVALTWGVFVTLYWVPSRARTRHPRQNASGSRRRVAIGRRARRIRSAKISHGSRSRRSDQELSVSGVRNNWNRCSANVPVSCIT